MNLENAVIVSRHQGLVDWLRDRVEGIENVEVISHVSDPEQIKGKVVFGVLPLSLAVQAEIVCEVSMPDLKPEQRGKELSIEEMDAAGAKLVLYSVSSIDAN